MDPVVTTPKYSALQSALLIDIFNTALYFIAQLLGYHCITLQYIKKITYFPIVLNDLCSLQLFDQSFFLLLMHDSNSTYHGNNNLELNPLNKLSQSFSNYPSNVSMWLSFHSVSCHSFPQYMC